MAVPLLGCRRRVLVRALRLCGALALILLLAPAKDAMAMTTPVAPTTQAGPVAPQQDDVQPVQVPITGALAVAAGGRHTCAITSSGGVRCWGSDQTRQIGDGPSTQDKLSPVNVVGLASGVTALQLGFGHSCALTTAGAVKCWGADSFGQLGNGAPSANQEIPVDVVGLPASITALAAGDNHTCALTAAGALFCWGLDDRGQVGNGPSETGPQQAPDAVVGLPAAATAIAAGGDHTCALTTAGAVYCWGFDLYGQVGDGPANGDKESPVLVSGLASGVAAISAGRYHTCARLVSGGVRCWGRDARGQLGNGALAENQPVPVNVAGLPAGPSLIEAGYEQSCAINGGALRCWGADALGQVGDGPDDGSSESANDAQPVAVVGLGSGVVEVSGGDAHTCARTTLGVIYCWGDNFSGQLGDGTTTRRYQPFPNPPPATSKTFLPAVLNQE